MNPNLCQPSKFRPVLRRPRREWHIPALDAVARLEQQEREEQAFKALAKGTTPQGREILRKILARTERMITDKKHPCEQIVATIEQELTVFRAYQPEFVLFLSRTWGIKEEKWRLASAYAFATLIVLRTASILVGEKPESNA